MSVSNKVLKNCYVIIVRDVQSGQNARLSGEDLDLNPASRKLKAGEHGQVTIPETLGSLICKMSIIAACASEEC